MYSLVISESFKKDYKKLNKKEQDAVDKKLVLLVENTWHSSLRIKKIKTTPFFECSVNMDIRIAFMFKEDRIIILLAVDHHDKLLNKAKRIP